MLVFPTMTKIEMLYFVSLVPFLHSCYAKPFNQMDGEVDEYRFSPYDALNQFRDEQYERQLPVPADLAPPPGIAWNFNVENIPVEPDSGYDPLPSIQRRHLKNLIRRFVDRDADTDFGLQERFYKKGGPGRSGNWSPFELQGAPVALKTKKPTQKSIKIIPRNFCDDKLSKLNRILIKEHQIQLQFQKSKGENIDVTFDSPMIIQQDQVSVDQLNDEPKSNAQQIINGNELNQEIAPKVIQQTKSEEEQYKPENKAEPENSDISPQGKQNKQEIMSENSPETIPQNRPESNPQNRPESNLQNRPESNPQNRPENIPQNRPENMPQNQPAIIPENVRELLPQIKPTVLPQNKPETVSQNRPQQTPLQNKLENVPETQNKPELISEEKPETASDNKPEFISPNKKEAVPQRRPGRVYEEKAEPAQQIKAELNPQQVKQNNIVPPARPNPIPQTKNVEDEAESNNAQQQKPSPEYKPYRVQPQAQSKNEASAKAGEVQSEKSDEIPQFFHILRNKEGNIEQQWQKVPNGNVEDADRQNPKAEEDKAPETVKNVVNRRLNTY